MKILFLTPRDSRKHIGGVETHVRLLTEELEKRGHEVGELALDECIKETPCSARSLLFKLQAWRYLWQKRDLFKWADIVHIHDVFWWYLPFRFVFPRKPVFTTFHGWEGEFPPSKSAIIQKRIAKMLSRGTIGVGNFFEKWYGVTPSRVVYGVLDPNISIALLDSSTTLGMTKNSLDCHVRQSRTRNDKPKSIAFYGRLDQVNGIDITLEAFRTLRGEKFQFLFIGDGPARKDAENIGRITGMTETPWKFLLQSDLVITSSYLCLLETAALIRPIISIATNPLKNDYLMTHPLAKYVTICHSPKEIADRILSYKKSKKQKTENTEDMHRAYRWATSQTVQKLADMYIELWSK